METIFTDLKSALAGENEPVTITNDPVEFIEKEMYIPETGLPMVLTEHQKKVLRTAFQRNENGHFKYSTIVYSSTKKSAKTSISAGIALWQAYNYPYGYIIVVGNDQRQASSRLYESAKICIRLNPRMKNTVKVKPSGYRIELPNNTVIDAIPVDPGGEAGGNPSAVFWTEAWAAKQKAALQLWTETTLSPTRFGHSFRLVESYAGYKAESPILEQLYEMGVVNGKRIDDEIEMYENAAASLFAYWNTKYRLPWQTDSYYAEQAAILTPSEFDRVHKNQWVSSLETFVPYEWWLACRQPIPPLEDGQPMIVSCDAAVSNDSFGIVMTSGREDGEHVDVRYARCWYPPKGGKLDFEEPEKELRRLIDEYAVIEVCYDPYMLEDLMSRIKKNLITHVKAFNQGTDRLIADKRLFDMIRERRIAHSGEIDLGEHIQNANAKSEGEKLRIVKRDDLHKIDLAVALSMATERSVHWGI